MPGERSIFQQITYWMLQLYDILKDKILVMENTVVARGLGWREEMNIKNTIRQFLEVIQSFCILTVLVVTGVMHVLIFIKLHSIKKGVNSLLWMLKHSSHNIFTTALETVLHHGKNICASFFITYFYLFLFFKTFYFVLGYIQLTILW